MSAAVEAGFAHFRRRAAWRPLEYAFWIAVVASLLVFPRRLSFINEVAILGLFVLSLDLILGFAGIVSLGHVAFFGVGAYAAALFGLAVFADPLVGVLVGGATAALVGFASSFLILRGSDLTRLMITLGVASLLYELANRLSWTGGANGLNLAPDPVFGIWSFDLFGRTAAIASLAVLFLLFLLARRIVHSPFGLSLRAVTENRLRAGAIGIPTHRRLVAIYTVSAAYAGIAGALLAETTQFVSLDLLAFHRSADALVVLVLGGAGTLYGGLVGAIVFRVLQDVVSDLTPQYWEFWVGVVLVLVVLAGRERLARIPANLYRRLGLEGA
ncbi:MAG TPA: branched-chain amino acid ABC transporter permease [Bauldia sp.]|nr:branched-chain amino acid ABC transporter permease [Bauldia sp.]